MLDVAPVELPYAQRVRLDALRYAAGRDEAPTYIAIMRTFTGQIAGLLSDQSAVEVARRLAAQGIEIDADTVDDRLSYLVEHGNLARSPRESEARSLREYLHNRARYQLTQRGELVHRFVEELLVRTSAGRWPTPRRQFALACVDGVLASGAGDVVGAGVGPPHEAVHRCSSI